MTETSPNLPLTDFLLARISEDEAVARAAVGLHFSIDTDWAGYAVQSHVLRWTSTRVLAECEAKRRIVEECSPTRLQDYDESATLLASVVLANLALPYADHPDYREEWKP